MRLVPWSSSRLLNPVSLPMAHVLRSATHWRPFVSPRWQEAKAAGSIALESYQGLPARRVPEAGQVIPKVIFPIATPTADIHEDDAVVVSHD